MKTGYKKLEVVAQGDSDNKQERVARVVAAITKKWSNTFNGNYIFAQPELVKKDNEACNFALIYSCKVVDTQGNIIVNS